MRQDKGELNGVKNGRIPMKWRWRGWRCRVGRRCRHPAALQAGVTDGRALSIFKLPVLSQIPQSRVGFRPSNPWPTDAGVVDVATSLFLSSSSSSSSSSFSSALSIECHFRRDARLAHENLQRCQFSATLALTLGMLRDSLGFSRILCDFSMAFHHFTGIFWHCFRILQDSLGFVIEFYNFEVILWDSLGFFMIL